MRNRKTKQQLVDDNEQAARIALYLPQLHAQKEKLEADLQELEHLALSGWGYADFHAGVNFAITEFSELRGVRLGAGGVPHAGGGQDLRVHQACVDAHHVNPGIHGDPV